MRIKDIADTINLYRCWRRCEGYIPRHVELMITCRCNSHCAMCNVWKLAKEMPALEKKELSTEDYINLFKELSTMGTKSIVLSGGEPTLRKDFIPLIFNAKQAGFEIEVITNGMLITEKMAKEIVDAGLDWISVSLDGHTPEIHEQLRRVKGGWEKAVRGIKFIRQARDAVEKPFINISHIVTKMNYRYIGEMIRLKSELGFDSIAFNPIIKKVKSNEELFLRDDDLNYLVMYLAELQSEFEEAGIPENKLRPLIRLCQDKGGAVKGRYAESLNERTLCFAPWRMTTIDPFGNVYPCCFATPFQNLSDDLEQSFWGENDFCMGNIKGREFKEIWNGKRYRWFRELCKEPPTFPFCDWCNYLGSRDQILTGLFKDRSLLYMAVVHKFGGAKCARTRTGKKSRH